MGNSVQARSTVLWLVVSLAGAPTGVAFADDASSRKAAVDLLSLMDMENLLKQGIEQELNAQLQGTPMAATLGPKIKGFLSRYLTWKTLEPEFVALYQKSFSEEELTQLIAFYKSPLGKKTIAVMPRLQMQGAQIAKTKVQAHMNELLQMLQAAPPGSPAR
jgi:hypothetical protein